MEASLSIGYAHDQTENVGQRMAGSDLCPAGERTHYRCLVQGEWGIGMLLHYWLRKLRKEAFESQETQLESQLVPTFCELSPVPNTLESQVDARDEKIDSRHPSLILVNLKLPNLSLEVAGGVNPQEVKVALA